MNDDIISRSALKEDFESRLALCNEWIEKAKDKETKIRADATKHFICEVIMTIDNAKPVNMKPFANVIFDKDELRRLADEKVVKAIKSGELVVKTEGEWTPVLERLPEGKIDPITKDFEPVLCSTIWDDVRVYKFGKPIGHDKAHFWSGGGIMDKYVIAWKPMPEPYKEEKI